MQSFFFLSKRNRRAQMLGYLNGQRVRKYRALLRRVLYENISWLRQPTVYLFPIKNFVSRFSIFRSTLNTYEYLTCLHTKQGVDLIIQNLIQYAVMHLTYITVTVNVFSCIRPYVIRTQNTIGQYILTGMHNTG